MKTKQLTSEEIKQAILQFYVDFDKLSFKDRKFRANSIRWRIFRMKLSPKRVKEINMKNLLGNKLAKENFTKEITKN